MRIFASKLYSNGKLHKQQAVMVDEGRILSFSPASDDENFDMHVELITPAFVDLQVNGGGGVLWNSQPDSKGALSILLAHQALGTKAILPTLITDNPELMERAVDAMLELWGEKGILGVHLEGPHLNLKKKGTHSAKFIRPFDAQTFNQLKRLRDANIPVLLTLAPECVSLEALHDIKSLGVQISVGHTMATFEQAQTAFKNGVSIATHLFNAMPIMQSRDAGIVAAAILADVDLGIISDGIHVQYPMIELAYRAHNKDHIFIVSDAMPTVGGSDKFTLYDMEIKLENGRLVNPKGALAGAHIDMLGSVRNLANHTSIPLEDIIKMAATNPYRAMNLPPQDSLIGSSQGEWLALDENYEMVRL